MDVEKAAVLAARVNRLAGLHANPTPATQVLELIQHIPRAMTEILKKS
jgi:NAD(P)H-hydrate repair Nnr-like enzyme with NAD(P)H-hydrate dehydratase domain